LSFYFVRARNISCRLATRSFVSLRITCIATDFVCTKTIQITQFKLVILEQLSIIYLIYFLKSKMKEYLKWIKHWLWIVSVLVLTWIITVLVIKARTSADPNLWDNGTSLYTNVNETLSAAKRNALVKKTERKEMNLNDTTTLFNVDCERKRLRWWATEFASQITTTNIMFKTNDNVRRWIKNTNKKQVQKFQTDRVATYYDISKLYYRCP